MNADRYIRVVLSIIASALVLLVFQNASLPAAAQSPSTCGGMDRPCLVAPAWYDSPSGVWRPCNGSTATCFTIGLRP